MEREGKEEGGKEKEQRRESREEEGKKRKEERGRIMERGIDRGRGFIQQEGF